MKLKNIILLTLLMLFVALPISADPTSDEIELYELIMKYRAQKGLPEIPFSVSLTKVAQIHAKDVYDHYNEIPKGCNPHSWSSHGNWSKCDYYEDHRNGKCIWNKPRELTSYKGNGYEIIHYYVPPTSADCTPQGALSGWKSSPGHNSVILNLNIWNDSYWQAIGVGMYKGVACVWFGELADPEGIYIIQED